MNQVKIVTHNGNFHVDDVFAVASLCLLHNDNVEITRSRDEHIIVSADIVVDAGMVYDPDKNRFDHHQKGGAGQRDNGVFYSSFGLVWKKFGNEICGDERIASDIDKRLVMSIDAYDNGIEVTERVREDYPFRYSIFDIIKAFRPTWEESTEADFTDAFMQTVVFAKQVIKKEIKKLEATFKAEAYVESLYETAEDKKIIIIDPYAPWEDVIAKKSEPLFVIYPSLATKGGWCGEVVRDDPAVFTSNRISFPQSWAGKENEDFVETAGVKDAVFAHRRGFLVVARSKEAVLELVTKALLAGERR